LTEVQTDTSDLDRYEMDMFQVQYGTNNIPTATVELTTPDKRKVNGACTGSGSVEALYETLDRLIVMIIKLIVYNIRYVVKCNILYIYKKLNIKNKKLTATVEITIPKKRKVNGSCTGSVSIEAL